MADAIQERKCETCGAAFQCRRWRIVKGHGKFCSVACRAAAGAKARNARHGLAGASNPNWKGGVAKINARYTKRFVAKFPQKRKAHLAVRRAKKSGKLTPGKCADCRVAVGSHAHHEDYAKPLEVVWLCAPCHRKRHGASA